MPHVYLKHGRIVPVRAIIAAFHVLVDIELGKPRRNRFRHCFAIAALHLHRQSLDAVVQRLSARYPPRMIAPSLSF